MRLRLSPRHVMFLLTAPEGGVASMCGPRSRPLPDTLEDGMNSKDSATSSRMYATGLRAGGGVLPVVCRGQQRRPQ